jgi:hypothetical protein
MHKIGQAQDVTDVPDALDAPKIAATRHKGQLIKSAAGSDGKERQALFHLFFILFSVILFSSPSHLSLILFSSSSRPLLVLLSPPSHPLLILSPSSPRPPLIPSSSSSHPPPIISDLITTDHYPPFHQNVVYTMLSQFRFPPPSTPSPSQNPACPLQIPPPTPSPALLVYSNEPILNLPISLLPHTTLP